MYTFIKLILSVFGFILNISYYNKTNNSLVLFFGGVFAGFLFIYSIDMYKLFRDYKPTEKDAPTACKHGYYDWSDCPDCGH